MGTTFRTRSPGSRTMRCCRLALALAIAGALAGTEFHVAPAGSAANTGAAASPWSLAHALSHPAAVRPGDTIWLHGGTYVGRFVSELTGTAAAPIVIRQAAGERATIDGGLSATARDILHIRGDWTWYWGFEITSSDPKRTT